MLKQHRFHIIITILLFLNGCKTIEASVGTNYGMEGCSTEASIGYNHKDIFNITAYGKAGAPWDVQRNPRISLDTGLNFEYYVIQPIGFQVRAGYGVTKYVSFDGSDFSLQDNKYWQFQAGIPFRYSAIKTVPYYGLQITNKGNVNHIVGLNISLRLAGSLLND